MTEVFIEPELENLADEQTAAQWFEICSQLGLEHQLKHADRSEEKKAPPYMFVDPKTLKIIQTLCPRAVRYKEYSESTIPLDVLQEIQKCEKNGWYAAIYIHYDDQSPDPFVVGHTHENSWMAHKHLIARWGAELMPFEQLEVSAINRLREDVNTQLMELQAKVSIALANTDGYIRGLLANKNGLSLSNINLPF